MPTFEVQTDRYERKQRQEYQARSPLRKEVSQDDYIFACEIQGADHIIYSKPRKPKYHLVIIVIKGDINLIINGEHIHFGPQSYINLPTWADIYEIEYSDDFHAMVSATDKTIVEDIFRNRNPFPPDFRFQVNHSLGGDITSRKDMMILVKDIRNMIDSLSDKDHHFAEEINYAYFYILLETIWIRNTDTPHRHEIFRHHSEGVCKPPGKEYQDSDLCRILCRTAVHFKAISLTDCQREDQSDHRHHYRIDEG